MPANTTSTLGDAQTSQIKHVYMRSNNSPCKSLFLMVNWTISSQCPSQKYEIHTQDDFLHSIDDQAISLIFEALCSHSSFLLLPE